MFKKGKFRLALIFHNFCVMYYERHSNERIMNRKQERARRIDISQPPFLIETISPASAVSVPASFFQHVPTSPYAKISAFGVFRKRVITKSWGCPQAV